MGDLTAIYYTSNREDEKFENKIKQKLSEIAGFLPIISVSQKPIDFGKNICVGDVGLSDQNARRQFQIGAIEAKTKYVCAAESDFLYPPEYFQFKPECDDVIYRAKNIYVLWHHKAKFRAKERSEGAIVVNREYIVNAIDEMYDDTWNPEQETKENNKYLFKMYPNEPFHTRPLVTFKTGNSMHFGATTSRIDHDELELWGNHKKLREMYL